MSTPAINADWNTRLLPYMALGGGIVFEDPGNSSDLAPGVTAVSAGASGWMVSPVPGLTDGINNLFFNNHIAFTAWDPALSPFITTAQSTTVGLYGRFGSGCIVLTGPDQHFHAFKDGGSSASNQYNLLVNELNFVSHGCGDDQGPLTTNTTATANPSPVGSSVDVTANVDDTGLGDSDIASAEYSLDGGTTWSPMAASDGTFDEVAEDVTASYTATETGVFSVCVRGTDAPGNTGAPECIMLAVYDPSAGFVTGGGWIASPAGAYLTDLSLTGKANFGFVSKYKKGATVPTGNTEFQFKSGDLNFHSSSYDFLVITMGGTNAQYKGEGTINGSLAPTGAYYKFMIWARDLTPGGDDTFRIKIWYEDGAEMVVYDNGFNQAIGGGSIVIHSK